MQKEIPNSVDFLADSAKVCPACGSLSFNPYCPECVEVVQHSLLLSTFHQASAGRSC